MKRALVLFTLEFPYGVSEPFLENEYPLYKDYFDKVLLVTNRPRAVGARGQKTREVNDPAVEILESRFNRNLWQKLAFLWAVLTDGHSYTELWHILTRHGANLRAIRNLFSSIGKAKLCVRLAGTRCRELEKAGYQVVGAYAYWLNYPAYAAVRFNHRYYGGRLYTVSRAHRFDLYEERNPGSYILCRKYILEGLREIASISEDGVRYLERTHPDCRMNITIHRLGAKDVGCTRPVDKGETLKIVSCSRAVPVKRIHRIIDALAQIRDIPVEWTHCGGGDLLADIREKAATLPDNIRCVFTDTSPNTRVYELYRDNGYHAFVNVSSSEGVPVSIMEAMSFGMPVIATDVGGTAETIEEGETGYLLAPDYEDGELIRCLTRLYEMPAEAYAEMRRRARDKFEGQYHCLPNYRHFLQMLREHTDA